MTSPKVDPLSLITVRLRILANGREQGSATGFVVFHEPSQSHYLITNWHVVTNRDAFTGEQGHGAQPTRFEVALPRRGALGQWIDCSCRVHGETDTNRYFIEHPRGREVDLAAVKLDVPREAHVRPLDLHQYTTLEMVLEIGSRVHIVGYPLGLVGGSNFPLWKTGYVSSEPDFSPETLHIDARTFDGMSGSPVFYHQPTYRDRNGDVHIHHDKPYVQFLGVYSGRLTGQTRCSATGEYRVEASDIGLVWQPHLLFELLAAV